MNKYIIGCDEVGTGAIAGPLVVCGVKAPEGWNLDGLNDSKKLSAKKREIMRSKLDQLVESNEISFHISERSNDSIDTYGVDWALKNAYVEVFHSLAEHQPFLIIVDGNLKFDGLDVDDYDLRAEVRADGKYPTVMAASIIAKTFRDNLMHNFHKEYPDYGWDSNVGYGSKRHIEGISKNGYCELHRRSYRVKSLQ